MMIKKTSTFYFVVTFMLLFFYGCDKVDQHDFDNLRGEVEKNTEEINSLKALTTSLQEAISSGQLITAVEEVTKVENGETIAGIKVTFSGTGGVKTIWNGAKGKTPFLWVNSNGNWATFYDKIPADRDNASYEIKDAAGKSISAKGFKVEVVNKDGFIAFKVTDPNTGAETITVTAVPFDPSAKIVQSVTQDKYNVTFKVDGVDYMLMRDIKYPTSITMLAKSLYIEKGKTASFNIKVNPSNAVFETEKLSLGYVASMTRAATTVITNPDFVVIKSCEAVAADNTESGEYTITVEWKKDILDADRDGNVGKDRALFIIASTLNNKAEDIEIMSSTPVYLTEEFIKIEDRFIDNFDDIVMFQGETYKGEITLAKLNGQYLWDKGYVSTTGVTPNTPTGNITIAKDATDMFKFDVEAKVLDPAGPTKDYPSKVTISDIATPANSITKSMNIKVYPRVTTLLTKEIANNWIPIERKNGYVDFNFATELTNAGFASTVWDIASTSVEYFLGDMKKPLPASIVLYTPDVVKKDIKIDILPEILYGKHKVLYNIKATAKEGTRLGLPKEVNFNLIVEFEIKAPVFHLTLKAAIDDAASDYIQDNPNENFVLIGTRGTYTTIVNKAVAASDVFQVDKCINHSDEYQAEYSIAEKSPSYSYAPGSGTQGLMFKAFPVAVNWDIARTEVLVYSKLATGQEIPVYLDKYVTGTPHTSRADVGIIDVVFDKLALDEVKAPFKTGSNHACFNYSALQNISFNINDEFDIYGENDANRVLHPSCIYSVTYEVLDNTSSVVNIPRKLLTITANGVVTAALNATWDTTKTVKQPIKVTMTDIWGNVRSKTVEVWLNSNSVPTNDPT